ncbi:lachesin-like isoform X1 [Tigriopus californicus]|uniref:lachesin-like isoform X1 n=1 Tax=Tigriopus californicus TaxID=6832 RepID=UPI0027DA3BF6|nr:lachesin-like isoform X1 [Tigriopus californicus]
MLYKMMRRDTPPIKMLWIGHVFNIFLMLSNCDRVGTVSDPWRRRPQYQDFGLPSLFPPTLSPHQISTTETVVEEPIFDSSLVTNMTAQLGQTAHLHCKILNIKKGHPVSWIRRRDMHILTVDQAVFTKDARFLMHHLPESSQWTLMIKYLQKRDEGTYVCQVSTQTGVKSHYFNLLVTVPTAFILGSDEYHTQAGNAISLVCIIENSMDPPQYVFWYHNDQLINYDRVSRISIKTDPGPKTHTRLIINDVIKEDSGNYTCTAPNTKPSTIDVYVSPGDKTLSLSDHSHASSPHHALQSPHLLLVQWASIWIAIFLVGGSSFLHSSSPNPDHHPLSTRSLSQSSTLNPR